MMLDFKTEVFGPRPSFIYPLADSYSGGPHIYDEIHLILK